MATKDEIRELAISIGVSATGESAWPSLEARMEGLGFAQGRRFLEAYYERLGLMAPLGGIAVDTGPLAAVRWALDRAPHKDWQTRHTGKIMLHDWEGRSSLGFASASGTQEDNVFEFMMQPPKREETYGSERERFNEKARRKAQKKTWRGAVPD